MKLKLKAAEKASSSGKRDWRVLGVCNPKATTKCNLLESITQLHDCSVVSSSDEGGVVKMKIMVKKQQLKQMMIATMAGGSMITTTTTNQAASSSSSSLSLSSTLEQRLNSMRKRHSRRVDHMNNHSGLWRPALQCIPEE